MSFDVVRLVRERLLSQQEWPVHFVVYYGTTVYTFIVGLDCDDPAQGLAHRLEASAPGEVRARVLGRTEWQRMALELDTVLLEGFQQGTVLHDEGEWSCIAAHFQSLADRGLICKTRWGWRRPGDVARDPDAMLMAQIFQSLNPRRRSM